MVDYLPSPIDIPPAKGIDPKTGEEIEVKADDNAPFSALAFKIATDPFVGQLTFFRVYSGTVKAGSYVLNSTKGEKERIGRILRMHANHREEVQEIYSGGIGALVGMKYTTTGDTLCDPEHPVILGINHFSRNRLFPSPLSRKPKPIRKKWALLSKNWPKKTRLSASASDEETGQTIISGMGELHLDIIVDRMKREFKVEANVGRPQVAYRETIKETAEAEGKYIRQSGGRGQYGHAGCELNRMKKEKVLNLSMKSKAELFRRNLFRLSKRESKKRWTTEWSPAIRWWTSKWRFMTDHFTKLTLRKRLSKLPARWRLQEAVKRANPIILEPIMKVEVITPENFMGDVVGDLNSKRGIIQEIEDRGEGNARVKVIKSLVPLASMFGYATQLRSMTQGRANYNMEFDHYEEVPKNVAEEIKSGDK